MFVVTPVVWLFRLSGADYRYGFLWYLLALPLCWLLGAAVERWLSVPCEHWLRGRLITPARSDATAISAAG
jgi:hypothetical protein